MGRGVGGPGVCEHGNDFVDVGTVGILYSMRTRSKRG
jgi:hypothetical protein